MQGSGLGSVIKHPLLRLPFLKDTPFALSLIDNATLNPVSQVLEKKKVELESSPHCIQSEAQL